MKTIKITAEKVYDKEEKKNLVKDQEVERSNTRADDFINGGYAVDVTPEEEEKPKKSKEKK